MQHSILTCPNLWKDIKNLQKKHKQKETFPTLEEEGYSDEERIKNIPLMDKIVTYISNIAIKNDYGTIDQWDKQPYIDKGWEIWKVRYGFAGKGKSNGLRIVFVENRTNLDLLIVLIKTKAESANEKLLQKEVLKRLNNYFN